MVLDLRPLFAGEKDCLPIDGTLDFSSLIFGGTQPFRHPVRVTGQVTATAGLVMLEAVAAYTFEGACDRCAAPVTRPEQVPLRHVLVTSLNGEADDDLVVVSDERLRLDELVQEDLLLALPSKILCRPDCRGLCPQCGCNLNAGLCGCRTQTVDPRLALLQQCLSADESDEGGADDGNRS